MPKFSSPIGYTGPKATTTHGGQARFATVTEADAGLRDDLIISPLTLDAAGDILIPDASTTVKGKVELATNAEAVAGTDSVRAVTPSALQARLTSAALVGPGASPQISNNRIGIVSFSSVSIAAAATQTLTITNSTVTGATTIVSVNMYGGTTGSALSIQSVTASAGSLAIVVANGTGATTSTANLTFVFQVLG